MPRGYFYALVVLLCLNFGTTHGIQCLNCFSNAPPVPGLDTFMTKPSIRTYFKTTPMWITLPNCTPPEPLRFVECDGKCISMEIQYPEGHILGHIYTCSKQYKPFNFENLKNGECAENTHRAFMAQTHRSKAYVCEEDKCNMPADEKKPDDTEIKTIDLEPLQPELERSHPKDISPRIPSDKTTKVDKEPLRRNEPSQKGDYERSFFGGVVKKNGAISCFNGGFKFLIIALFVYLLLVYY